MFKKILFAACLATILIAAGCGWGGSSSTGDSVYGREPARERSGTESARRSGSAASRPGSGRAGASLFRLPMTDGQPVLVKAPAVLFFFTSWCGYCKQIMPSFMNLTQSARSKGWRVYGIDVGEGPQKANEVINQFNPNFPVLVDQQSMVARRYGIEGYPTFIIIDENANVVYNGHELPSGF